MSTTVRTRALVPIVTLVCLLLTGCGGIPPEPFVARQASDSPSARPPVTAAGLEESFRSFASHHHGGVSVAWAPAGAGGSVQALGSTKDQDAWSTIKVPISMAAVEDGEEDGPAERARIEKAIEHSDNDAAQALWTGLGDTEAASGKVERLLRAAGDTRTEVGQDADGEFSGWGRTVWRVDDSARFAAALPCSDDRFVLDAMSKIEPDHSWGIGTLTRPHRFKGGWGPSERGYLVRQLGFVDVHGGELAIALAVQPADGRHETATKTAGELVAWLMSHIGTADVGHCPQATTTGPTGSGDAQPEPGTTGSR